MALLNEVRVFIHESLLLRLTYFLKLFCHKICWPKTFFWKVSWLSDITSKGSYLLWKILYLVFVCPVDGIGSGNRTSKSLFSKIPSMALQGSGVALLWEVAVGESRLLRKWSDLGCYRQALYSSRRLKKTSNTKILWMPCQKLAWGAMSASTLK